MKKIATLIIATILAVSFVVGFAACNKTDKDAPIDLLEIYTNDLSQGEFTSYETVISALPDGWGLYAPGKSSSAYKNSDSGYLSDIDAFVLSKTVGSNTILTIMKCGASDVTFPENLAINALRVKNGVVVLKDVNGDISICNVQNGGVIIPRGVISGLTSSDTIDKAVKILSEDLIAVNPKFDKNATSNKDYTTIYRISTGSPVVRIKNAGGDISCLAGFDHDFIVSTDTKEDSVEVSRIFKIPATATALNTYDGTEYGYYPDNGNDEYYNEITYMGGGKFFIHEDWQVDVEENKDADYDYQYNGTYYKAYRYIYDANSDTRKAFVSDYYFLNLSNKYYGSERTGISAKSILNDGYYYATYCIIVDSNKNGYYDQFILDEKFNIVASLSGNLGVSVGDVENAKEISYFDLALAYVDEIGVVPLPSSGLRAVDRNGNVIFEDKSVVVTAAAYNSGMIIASKQNANGDIVYGAYNLDGQRVADFKYTSIDPFLGYYTIAVNNGKAVLLSKDGKEVEKMSDNSVPLADMAKTSSKTNIYKLGCYMYTEKRDGTSYFGIKNLNANVENNVIIEANMITGSLLYSPDGSPADVFVFAKYNENDTFAVYKLK